MQSAFPNPTKNNKKGDERMIVMFLALIVGLAIGYHAGLKEGIRWSKEKELKKAGVAMSKNQKPYIKEKPYN